MLAISVAAPELDAPAGAVVARAGARSELQARPAARSARVAKRRKRKVVKRAEAHRRATQGAAPELLPGASRRGREEARQDTGQDREEAAEEEGGQEEGQEEEAAHRRGEEAGRGRARKRKAPAAAKKRRTAAAKKKKAGVKKKAVKKHALGVTGWTEVFFLALLPFAVVGGRAARHRSRPPAA